MNMTSCLCSLLAVSGRYSYSRCLATSQVSNPACQSGPIIAGRDRSSCLAAGRQSVSLDPVQRCCRILLCDWQQPNVCVCAHVCKLTHLTVFDILLNPTVSKGPRRRENTFLLTHVSHKLQVWAGCECQELQNHYVPHITAGLHIRST